MSGNSSPIESFVDLLRNSQDEFDLVAACYQTIMIYHRGYEAKFVLDVENLQNKYPKYANALDYFFNNILDAFLDDDIEKLKHFTDTLNDIIRIINEIPLPKEIDVETHAANCAYIIIDAVDTFLDQVYSDNEEESHNNGGPLNQNVCCDECFVYFSESKSFLSDMYQHKSDGFRKPLTPTRLGSLFHRILIFSRCDFTTSAPKIKHVSIADAIKKQLVQEKAIRIASIPFIGFKTFDFCESNAGNICKDKLDGAFYIEYNQSDEEKNSENMLRLLEMTIQQNANIIVFPEFIMSKVMLDKLKSYLSNKHPENLALVIAGTNYEHESDGSGNNVMHIISRYGNTIGKYYKFSPFLTLDNEFVHGVPYGGIQEASEHSEESCTKNSNNRRRHFKNAEVVSNPGKECTMVDIEGIGRILPAICRDVTDGYYTDNLAKLFMPSLLLIPSWSKSVSSFQGRLLSIADTIHTTSVLCNCCNAVSDKKNHTGLLILPQKKDTYMKAAKFKLSRTQDCIKGCNNFQGCLHLIKINFQNATLNANVMHILA